MSLFTRVRKMAAGPPEGAHGQRNIDGSYFAIWKRPCGHYEIGEVDKHPDRERCNQCSMDRLRAAIQRDDWQPVEGKWTRATKEEAHDFVYSFEGPSMYSGVGFRML